MAKKPARQLAKIPIPTLPALKEPVDRRMGDDVVRVDAVYHVREFAPKTVGPWNLEAEKVAWTDAGSGYGCIIRRAAQGGFLCGYVGVGPEHPIFGYEASALRDLGLRAHGGINYARDCQKYESERSSSRYDPESRAICHTVTVYHTTREGRTVLEIAPHDEMWWIGFECSQPTDFIPELPPGHDPRYGPPSAPAGTVERLYRDEGYLLLQCQWLAAQLKALADGRDPAEVQEHAIPPLGFDPSKAGR